MLPRQAGTVNHRSSEARWAITTFCLTLWEALPDREWKDQVDAARGRLVSHSGPTGVYMNDEVTVDLTYGNSERTVFG